MRDHTANPAPLGLCGFGLATVLLNLHNVGLFPMDAMILGMGFFYGGVAQIIAGIMEWKKGNTFATTAFTSYGLFWLSLVAILTFPAMGLGASPEPVAMGSYFLIWGLFTWVLWVFQLGGDNRGLQTVFGLLTLLFGLLAIGFVSGEQDIIVLAGVEGVLTGLVAMFVGLKQVFMEK